jgi:two-component system OmpR family response regulator
VQRLLVVDDEPTIVSLLSASLRFVGFEVRTAASGAEALRIAAEFKPELLVLDVMLPDYDGFEVVRRLRSNGRHIPVLFLTARDGVQDKITGLTVGGDDYVTKPFSLEEVVARIKAVLRRTYAPLAPADQRATLRFHDLEMDEETHDVTRGGKLIKLSPTEYKLLHYLLANAERVVSKAQILDHVWRYDFGGDARIVESYISMLRRKVDITDIPLIHTLRGFGYSLRTPRP